MFRRKVDAEIGDTSVAEAEVRASGWDALVAQRNGVGRLRNGIP